MPIYQRGDASIYYETHGSGFPVLLIAPGGMKSAISFWQQTPWNPIEQLAGDYQVIAMDQRNAGRSSAAVSAEDSWSTYTADQLGLMAHLGFERFHIAGMCIGGPYCLAMIQQAPQSVVSATLFQTIALDDNRDAFYAMFDDWAKDLQGADAQALASFRENMYGVEPPLLSVDDAFISVCPAPLLVLMGNDLYHPQSGSRHVAELAPDATFIEQWKEGEACVQAQQQFADFLSAHTPT